MFSSIFRQFFTLISLFKTNYALEAFMIGLNLNKTRREMRKEGARRAIHIFQQGFLTADWPKHLYRPTIICKITKNNIEILFCIFYLILFDFQKVMAEEDIAKDYAGYFNKSNVANEVG
jgi:hypothetical protein